MVGGTFHDFFLECATFLTLEVNFAQHRLLDICLELVGFLVVRVWLVSRVSSLLEEFGPINIRMTGRNARPWKSP